MMCILFIVTHRCQCNLYLFDRPPSLNFVLVPHRLLFSLRLLLSLVFAYTYVYL